MPTKEAPIEILSSVILNFCKRHSSSVPEYVAARENDNGILLGEYPKLLISGDLTPLLSLKLLFVDSGTDLDTSVVLVVIFSVEGKFLLK